MIARLLATILAVGLLAGTARAAVEHVTIKGAQDVIIIPDDWNGSVFLYAHGYTADKRILEPIPDDLTKLNILLLPGLLVPPGSAAAITTFAPSAGT